MRTVDRTEKQNMNISENGRTPDREYLSGTDKNNTMALPQ